jgi:hypothetical protein
MIEFLGDLLYYAAIASSYLVAICFGAVVVFCVIGLVGMFLSDGGHHA